MWPTMYCSAKFFEPTVIVCAPAGAANSMPNASARAAANFTALGLAGFADAKLKGPLWAAGATTYATVNPGA